MRRVPQGDRGDAKASKRTRREGDQQTIDNKSQQPRTAHLSRSPPHSLSTHTGAHLASAVLECLTREDHLFEVLQAAHLRHLVCGERLAIQLAQLDHHRPSPDSDGVGGSLPVCSALVANEREGIISPGEGSKSVTLAPLGCPIRDNTCHVEALPLAQGPCEGLVRCVLPCDG